MWWEGNLLVLSSEVSLQAAHGGCVVLLEARAALVDSLLLAARSLAEEEEQAEVRGVGELLLFRSL